MLLRLLNWTLSPSVSRTAASLNVLLSVTRSQSHFDSFRSHSTRCWTRRYRQAERSTAACTVSLRLTPKPIRTELPGLLPPDEALGRVSIDPKPKLFPRCRAPIDVELKLCPPHLPRCEHSLHLYPPTLTASACEAGGLAALTRWPPDKARGWSSWSEFLLPQRLNGATLDRLMAAHLTQHVGGPDLAAVA